jgi:hypothetical protein
VAATNATIGGVVTIAAVAATTAAAAVTTVAVAAMTGADFRSLALSHSLTSFCCVLCQGQTCVAPAEGIARPLPVPRAPQAPQPVALGAAQAGGAPEVALAPARRLSRQALSGSGGHQDRLEERESTLAAAAPLELCRLADLVGVGDRIGGPPPLPQHHTCA